MEASREPEATEAATPLSSDAGTAAERAALRLARAVERSLTLAASSSSDASRASHLGVARLNCGVLRRLTTAHPELDSTEVMHFEATIEQLEGRGPRYGAAYR